MSWADAIAAAVGLVSFMVTHAQEGTGSRSSRFVEAVAAIHSIRNLTARKAMLNVPSQEHFSQPPRDTTMANQISERHRRTPRNELVVSWLHATAKKTPQNEKKAPQQMISKRTATPHDK